jgi:hypothetical protein
MGQVCWSVIRHAGFPLSKQWGMEHLTGEIREMSYERVWLQAYPLERPSFSCDKEISTTPSTRKNGFRQW